MNAPASIALNVRLFGPLQLWLEEIEVDTHRWKSKKALTLFKILAERAGTRFPKDVLIEALWGGDDDFERSSHNLHTVVYYLRRELEPRLQRYERPRLVKHSAGLYWLERNSDVWVDVVEFRRLVREAEAQRSVNPVAALEGYRRALGLYTDDFLPENLYDDWAADVRESLRERYFISVAALAELTDKLNANRAAAITLCRQALQRDPLREELHRALINLLRNQGLYGEAAEQYRQCERILHKEFRVQPSPETRFAYERLKIQTKGPASTETSAVQVTSASGTLSSTHLEPRPGASAGPSLGVRADAESRLLEGSPPGVRADAPSGGHADAQSGVRADAPSGGHADARSGVRADAPSGGHADARSGVRADAPSGGHGDSSPRPEPAPTSGPNPLAPGAHQRVLIQMPATEEHGSGLVKARLREALEQAGLEIFNIRHVVIEAAVDLVASSTEPPDSTEQGRNS